MVPPQLAKSMINIISSRLPQQILNFLLRLAVLNPDIFFGGMGELLTHHNDYLFRSSIAAMYVFFIRIFWWSAAS